MDMRILKKVGTAPGGGRAFLKRCLCSCLFPVAGKRRVPGGVVLVVVCDFLVAPLLLVKKDHKMAVTLPPPSRITRKC
jgi:hypothetical protein